MIRNTEVIMFYYYKYLDDNLLWLTEKAEKPKSNKGSFTFLIHIVNVIELWHTHHYFLTLIFQVYSPFPIKNLAPLPPPKKNM